MTHDIGKIKVDVKIRTFFIIRSNGRLLIFFAYYSFRFSSGRLNNEFFCDKKILIDFFFLNDYITTPYAAFLSTTKKESLNGQLIRICNLIYTNSSGALIFFCFLHDPTF